MSGGVFVRDLEDLSDVLETLGVEAQRIAEHTMVSACWGVLRRIRVVWPVDTGLSRGLWGFKQIRGLHFVIFNTAKNSVGKQYAGWVYAKGDKARHPIAPSIVQRAIDAEADLIEENFLERLQRWLSK